MEASVHTRPPTTILNPKVQSHLMLSRRSIALASLSLLIAAGIFACAGSDSDDGIGGPTAELAVPPPEQVLAPANTATPLPTATPEPTATSTSEPIPVAPTEKTRVNVPNRGYNALGNPDAPITMFDFSDFL